MGHLWKSPTGQKRIVGYHGDGGLKCCGIGLRD
jgi:hypothetical protein